MSSIKPDPFTISRVITRGSVQWVDDTGPRGGQRPTQSAVYSVHVDVILNENTPFRVVYSFEIDIHRLREATYYDCRTMSDNCTATVRLYEHTYKAKSRWPSRTNVPASVLAAADLALHRAYVCARAASLMHAWDALPMTRSRRAT